MSKAFDYPFDESYDSRVALDFSGNNNNAYLYGKSGIVAGKYGNALKVSSLFGATATDIPIDLDSDFTIVFLLFPFAADKIMLSITYENAQIGYSTEINIAAGIWQNISIVKSGDTISTYKDFILINELNTQNGYEIENVGVWGGNIETDQISLLDRAFGYSSAISIETIKNEFQNMGRTLATYTLDGVDLREYGVYVSASSGLFDLVKRKTPNSVDWPAANGIMPDLSNTRFQQREINLTCFLVANSNSDFVVKATTFFNLFKKAGTRRLNLELDGFKPIPYEVYCQDGAVLDKVWSQNKMGGNFPLKLIEPTPEKKVLKFSGNGTVDLSLTTTLPIDIYWGDGTQANDAFGNIELSHVFNSDSVQDYYIIIAGVVDEIQNLTTNATEIWTKL